MLVLHVHELNFEQKKAALKTSGLKKYRRMLSSFSYDFIIQTIKSRSFRFGVKLHQVNPAFTSIIGKVKFAYRYGLSIDQAAALCIGRRLLGFSEKLPNHQAKIPDGKGGYVTFSVPARNRKKHCWSTWRAVKKKIPAVLAAHFRAALSRSTDPPKSACATEPIPNCLV